MIHYETEQVVLHAGDCLDVMRQLPDASVDAVCTDPPYGLSNTDPGHVIEALARWLAGDRDYIPATSGGFMGQEWDSFVPPVAVWDEVFRVLKPGGHLLCFAGTRTVDLMGLAIRLAGFEIRDSIAWLYGSGFPKSLDVSKAIDKQRDDKPDARRVAAWLKDHTRRAGITAEQLDAALGGKHQANNYLRPDLGRTPPWDTWLHLKKIVGFPDDMDAEVWRLNGRKGAPGDNWAARTVVGTRIVAADRWTAEGRAALERGESSYAIPETAATGDAQKWAGWGTALKPAFEPIVVARKPLAGTVAQTVLQYGTGALNIDASRIGTADCFGGGASSAGRAAVEFVSGYEAGSGFVESTKGRWPANVALDASQAAALNAQSGTLTSDANPARSGADGDRTAYGTFAGQADANPQRGADTGGASRFFKTANPDAPFRYTAKAGGDERSGVDGVSHPTVKPLDLMRWLVRLVTPKGGVVLEPFAGSGTTVEACVLEGFRCIAIEREADYLPLIMQRIGKPHAVGLDFGDWEDAS